MFSRRVSSLTISTTLRIFSFSIAGYISPFSCLGWLIFVCSSVASALSRFLLLSVFTFYPLLPIHTQLSQLLSIYPYLRLSLCNYGFPSRSLNVNLSSTHCPSSIHSPFSSYCPIFHSLSNPPLTSFSNSLSIFNSHCPSSHATTRQFPPRLSLPTAAHILKDLI